MFKKILYAFLILIGLILAAIIVLPYLFKDQIFQAVKDTANENMNATLDFGEFDLSIFSNFPDFTLTIEDVKVTGVDTFAGVELANIGELTLTVDLEKVVMDGEYALKSFGLVDPAFHVKVLRDGTANYDIAVESDEVEEPEAETSEPTGDIAFEVEEYYIENLQLIYDDVSIPTYAKIENLSHKGSASYQVENEKDKTALETNTTVDAITVRFDGVEYLSKVKTAIDFNADIFLSEGRYVFKENNFKLNDLELGFDGSVVMPEGSDDIDLDITFNSPATSFKSILSMVPGVYTADFAGIETGGSMSLQGMAKGTYADPLLPAFDLTMKIMDGRFNYPDLPKSVENIRMDLQVNNPGGSEDNTVVNLKEFYMEMAENPVRLSLITKTPISDPYIDARLETDLDLESLADVMPLEEGEVYKGKIKANVTMKGYQSSIDNEQYEEFEAAGDVYLQDFDYQSPDLPYETQIQYAHLVFSPQEVELANYEMTIGKSDIQADGKIENFIAYYLADEPLRGVFNMNSNLMDLNEFMEEDEETTEVPVEGEGEEEAYGVIEVPANLDFLLNAKIGTILYDNMEIKNLNGAMTVREQKVSMDKVAMDLLGGSMEMSGSYATVNPEKPDVDFFMDIVNWDVQETFNTFNTVQSLAPIGDQAFGSFSMKTSLIASLLPNLDADLNSLSGNGEMKTNNVIVKNASGAMAKVGDLLKTDDLKQLVLDNVNIFFFFEDGKVNVKPFDLKLGSGGDATFSGSHAFSGDLDYVMQTEVPSGQYGDLANDFVSGALGDFLGGAKVVPEKLLFDVLIGGTQTDPKVSLVPRGGSGTSVTDGVKEQVEEKVEEIKEEVKEEIDKKKEEAKAELQARKKQLMADAEKQANQIRQASKNEAERARKAGYDEAQKLEDAAKNPLKKAAAKVAADKVRKETDKKADQIIAEGNKKADKVMEEARNKANNLK